MYFILYLLRNPVADGKNTPFVSYRYPSLQTDQVNDETDAFSHPVTQFCFPDINQFPTETMERYGSFVFQILEVDFVVFILF